jgi:hypothetical protein
MSDTLLELIRIFPIVLITLYLFILGNKHKQYKEKGWIFIVAGFFLLSFATIIDYTDNFESLNKYVIIGDTPIQAFLEKVVGYLGGFLMLAMGLLLWMPKILKLSEVQNELNFSKKKLEKINNELERKVKEKTKEITLKNKELEKTLEDFYTLRIDMEKDLKKDQVKKENKKIKSKLYKLKKNKF